MKKNTLYAVSFALLVLGSVAFSTSLVVHAQTPSAADKAAAQQAGDAAQKAAQDAIKAGYVPPASPTIKTQPAAPSGAGAVSNESGGGFAPLNRSLPGIGDFADSPSIPNLLNNIYKIAIGLAAILAVLQIMRAGVLYMGGDSITEKKEAKDLIAMSLIGLLLVLAPTIVFSIINPDILKLQIGAGALKTQFKDSPSDSFANSANPDAARAICAQYTGNNLKQISNPDNKSCSALPGAGTGWSAVPECCPNLPTGSACCGYSASNTTTSTPTPNIGVGNFILSIVQQDTLNKCYSYLDNKYQTKAICDAQQAKVASDPNSAVYKDCSGKEIDSPAARYASIIKLPLCPR